MFFFQKIRNFFRPFKNLVWIKKCDANILVYDSCGFEYIKRCIPSGVNVKILSVRDHYIAVFSLSFLVYFVIYLFVCRSSSLALVASFVRTLNFKVVITFIDNSDVLSKLKKLFPNIHMVSIQNGTRWDLSRPRIGALSFDHFFCFGEVEKEILVASGFSYNKLYPVGSLKLDDVSVNDKKIIRDLCFISQFDTIENNAFEGWGGDVGRNYYDIGKQLVKNIFEFALLNDLSFAIALRTSPDSIYYEEECEYYKNCTSDNIILLPNTIDCSSYESALESKLVIAISSTLAFEILGLGKKVLFSKDISSVSSLVLQGAWHTNYITTHIPEIQRLFTLQRDELSLKILSLLKMSDDEYFEYTKESRHYYMNYDVNIPASDAVRAVVAKLLSLNAE